MAHLDLRLTHILTSPLPRAHETAEIVAKALRFEHMKVEERLASGVFSPGQLQTLLEHHANSDRILLVGHEPGLSITVGWLIGGANVEMKKGGLAYVTAERIEPGEGVLRWLLTPRLLTI